NQAYAQDIRDLDSIEALKSKWEEVKKEGLSAGDVEKLTDKLKELGGDNIEGTGVGELLDSMNANAGRLAKLKDAGDKLEKTISLVEKFKNLKTGDEFDAKDTLEALSDTIKFLADLMEEVPPPFGIIVGPMLKAYAEAIDNSATHAAAIQAATNAKNEAIAAAGGKTPEAAEPEEADDSFEWNVYPYPNCPECELEWWMAGNAAARASALEGAYERAQGEADAMSRQAEETRDRLVSEGYRETTAERMANEQEVLFEGEPTKLIDAFNRLLPEVQRLKEKFENAEEHAEKMRQIFLDCLEDCLKKAREEYGYIPGYDLGQGEPISYAIGSLADLKEIRIGNENPEWCKTTDGNPRSVPIDSVDPRDLPLPGTTGPPDKMGPPGEGGAPGTITPPGTQLDPSDEIEYLERLLTQIGIILQEEELTDEEFAQIEDRVRQIDKRLEELNSQLEEDAEDPRDVEEPETTQPSEPFVPTVTIYVKAKTDVLMGVQDAAQAVVKRQFKFFSASVENPALPGDGADKPQTDHNLGPIQGTTDEKGNLTLKVPMTALGVNPHAEQPLSSIGGPAFQVTVDTTPQSSVNVKVAGDDLQIAAGGIPDSAQQFLVDASKINGSVFLTFTFPTSMEGSMNKVLVTIPGVVNIEINFCRTKRVTLDDPYFVGKGGWGQSYDDQWAIKRVGFTDGEDSAWNKLGANPQPVIVAVIDSGLDWNHLDFDWKNLWQNPNEIPNNGKDDDGNGYIDDIIGWDFMANSNKPWDHDGHGTIVSGIIAATQNNGIGIAGINPHALIMVCKALNNFGNTRASYLAKAIVYAVDNGAQVINMSVGGENLTQIEQEAVAYAEQNGVLIVVASGNESVNVEGLGLASIDGVLTVASTGLDDKRSVFSNWGSQIDIAAPGIEVLGLRARLTDTMQDIPGVEYVNGASFVGEDNRYYRGSGTSFSAPLVTGIASLVMSKHPEYTGAQVAQILKQSATDIDVPGVDQYSGYGLVNAAAALMADPEYYLEARISQIQGVQEGDNIYLEVVGTAIGSEFKEAWIELGEGETPQSWKKIIVVPQAVEEGRLGLIPSSNFTKPGFWTVRVIVQDREGNTRESRGSVEIE
ncbi:MAG: S8 family peptidase, partial [Candidatus Aminicenantaceae bacterium]